MQPKSQPASSQPPTKMKTIKKEGGGFPTVPLTDDVIVEIFRYAGPGNFRFFAGTSKQFYRSYKLLRDNYEIEKTMKQKQLKLLEDNKKETTKNDNTTTSDHENENDDENINSNNNATDTISDNENNNINNNNNNNEQQQQQQQQPEVEAEATPTKKSRKRNSDNGTTDADNPWSLTTDMSKVVETMSRCKFYYEDEILICRGPGLKQRKLDQLGRLAATYGNLECLQFAASLGCSLNLTSVASAHGQLSILKWIHEACGCNFDAYSCRFAGAGGHLLTLQWLRSMGCPWDKWTCAYAAMNRHLHVLQWARANDCPWHALTCAYIARNGDLDMLKWARENGCKWDKMTCAYAAMNGHLEVLQWARRNRCPWDKKTSRWAAQNGHEEVLRWAIENGCPRDF